MSLETPSWLGITMAAILLGEGISHVGCLLKVICVTAAVIIKQSQFLWGSGKKIIWERRLSGSSLIMCTFLRANSQRNKVTTFSYHQMPFLSIKALLLVPLSLRSTCRKAPRREGWGLAGAASGLCIERGFTEEEKGCWGQAEEGAATNWDLGHLSQPPWPPLLGIRNLPQRVLVGNKRGSLMWRVRPPSATHYVVNTEERVFRHIIIAPTWQMRRACLLSAWDFICIISCLHNNPTGRRVEARHSGKLWFILEAVISHWTTQWTDQVISTHWSVLWNFGVKRDLKHLWLCSCLVSPDSLWPHEL